MVINIPTKAEVNTMRAENLAAHHERVLKAAESAAQAMVDDIATTIAMHGKIIIAAEPHNHRNMGWIEGEHNFYGYFPPFSDAEDYDCIYRYLQLITRGYEYHKRTPQADDTFNTIREVFDSVLEEMKKQGYIVKPLEIMAFTPDRFIVKM